jgi:gliding motility-associated protein GldM
MYLVFIAMLALNMSKEVLSAFGVINEDVVKKVTETKTRSIEFLGSLEKKAEKSPLQYKEVYELVDSLYNMGQKLDSYILSIKPLVIEKTDKFDLNNDGTKTDNIGDYEKMDGTKTVDELFFLGKGYAPEGQRFVDEIVEFRTNAVTLLRNKDEELAKNGKETLYTKIIASIEDKFDTSEKRVNNKDPLTWLDYNYKGFPLIASITKMSLIQDDISKIMFNVLTLANNDKLLEIASTNTLRAVVIPGFYNEDDEWVSTSGTVFRGENFKGKVILAKYDSTLAPNLIKIPDYFEGTGTQALADKKLRGGEFLLDIPSPKLGDREVQGELFFDVVKGLTTFTDTIDLNYTYAVTEKPKSASISNVKMNVVYEAGIPNILKIGVPTIKNEDLIVTVNGRTLPKQNNAIYGSVYILNKPKQSSGLRGEVVVKVSVKKSELYSDIGPFEKKFRIKKLGNPDVIFNNNPKVTRWNESALRTRDIQHKYVGEDIDLPLKVISFKVSIAGKAPISVSGSSIGSSTRAKTQLSQARKGAYIVFSDITSVGTKNATFNRTTEGYFTLRKAD